MKKLHEQRRNWYVEDCWQEKFFLFICDAVEHQGAGNDETNVLHYGNSSKSFRGVDDVFQVFRGGNAFKFKKNIYYSPSKKGIENYQHNPPTLFNHTYQPRCMA